MYDFILQIFIMVSLGTVIFLAARVLPRISETVNTSKTKANRFSSFPFEKIDAAVNAFLEKTLRKIKLIFLKMDNTISKLLEKFKKNGDGGSAGNGLTK
ncbi:MAG: hypothetical protein Q8N22_00305 [bacterium]|nr:hypothetical protein [bacterium]